MPLRDHFRPPLDDRFSWDRLHGQWPAMIVLALSRRLPHRFVAAPRVHLGSAIEIDVATVEEQDWAAPPAAGEGEGSATADWAPPRPTLTVSTDFPDMDEYEVQVYDIRRGRRLVAAVEIVSPSSKDRPEHRRAFVAKCATMLREHVCVAIVDLVTTRSANLYSELFDLFGRADPDLADDPPPLYAAACRLRHQDGLKLESWAYPLALGQPLPTLPLWLDDDHAVPLELEATYEETCRTLRIP
jgi:hypothetical protein